MAEEDPQSLGLGGENGEGTADKKLTSSSIHKDVNGVEDDLSDLQIIDIVDACPDIKRSDEDFTLRTVNCAGDSTKESIEQAELRQANMTNYKYPDKSSELLRELNGLRLANKLVDVSLVSFDGVEFPCHRAVLAASSPYFAAMLTDDLQESHSERIELTNISGTSLNTILHAVYMCDADISSQTVHDLLATAHFLIYPHIVESCCQFLKDSLSPQNCLGIAQLAEMYLCIELQDQAWNYALSHFSAVSTGHEFVHLEASILEKLVSSDDVNVAREDEVLAAVLQWATSDPTHIPDFPSVLAKVRLPLVNDDYLTSVLSSYHILHGSGKNLSLIRDSQNMKELARNGRHRDHPLLKPRHAMRSEVLVVVGGMTDNSKWVRNVHCLNPKNAEWLSMADLPFDHSDYSVASIDDAIYVSGGFHRNDVAISEVWRYDEMHDKWCQVRPIVLPRFNHTSIGYDHHIYVLGGDDSDNILTEVERYSPESDAWEIIGTINPTGSGMAVVGLSDKLYIIGWLTNVRLMCVVQCFDLKTRECTVIPCSGLNMQHFPAVAINNSIFILGGNRMRQVAIYDPYTFTSKKAESMKFKRNTPSATVVGGKIYVTGSVLRQHVAEVESYDPELDLWDTVSPMPHAVSYHGCVMIKKYLGPPYHT